ncbi:hypothetical protein H5410_045018 [Solanum commersonii]|uniref:Uncharacterized protein n=1 Tax=Solanum commersonii TaxID=4109 RepID=A0A9J5XCI4_SOLCO|nr:hypothetical protein H5410_045018 [Solanum commersonii]
MRDQTYMVNIEWVKVSPDLNELYNRGHIYYHGQNRSDLVLHRILSPWIHKMDRSGIHQGTNSTYT